MLQQRAPMPTIGNLKNSDPSKLIKLIFKFLSHYLTDYLEYNRVYQWQFSVK